MTDLRKAAEIALDAFENPLVAVNGPSWEDAIQALRQALAEDALQKLADIDHSIGLFVDSPKKWVGLTDSDKQEAFDETQEASGGFWEFADYLEAKLKEKNT